MATLLKIFRIFLIIVLLFIGDMSEASVTKDMRTITDMAGRKLKVPNKIERVVPLGSGLRFLTYMQAVDKIVGIEAFEKKNKNTSSRPYSLAIADKVDKIPEIGEGGPGKLPDFEKIISIKPDLIIAMGLDISMVEMIQQKTGIPIIVLSYGGTGAPDLGMVIDSLRMLGKLLRKEKRADYLISYINSIQSDLQRRTSTIKEKPTVYVGAVSYSGRHGITSTQVNYLPLMLINGNNVANEIKKSGPIFLDKERILQWNPDLIFIDMSGIDLVRDDYQKNPDFYKKLKAVKEGQVFSVLPFNHYHTNIEIALANAYQMGKVIYPLYFKDINPEKKADEIFKVFNGIEAYKNLKKEYYGFGHIKFGKDTVTIE